MRYLTYVLVIAAAILVVGCNNNNGLSQKGFSVESTEHSNTTDANIADTLAFKTQPRSVLSTAHAAHRLTPIYKINYNQRTKTYFVGSNDFYGNYYPNYEKGNNWNGNLMPGFEALHGYNFVNVSHYNNTTHTANTFFEKPVLIKTLYYPTFSKDTLNYKPVTRDFYMVSVYDKDTNNDKQLTTQDLRHLYYFDIHAENQKALIPENYSVLSSEYDMANDVMYVFARKDTNINGMSEVTEPINIFWIDLKNPENNGQQYEN